VDNVCQISIFLRVLLYYQGEETVEQIASRVKRLGLSTHGVFILSETNVEEICT
jgi:predicted ATP-dependent serine protease